MPSHCSTMFHRWCCMLWIMGCSKPSPYFFLFPIILVQVDLNFSRPKNAFPELVWIFLNVFWQSLIWPCLHVVVNSLYLLSWSLLLIVDFDIDIPTSWRVFFSWLDVVKGFFFTMERILRSSTIVVLRGRPGLFMLLSSPVCSVFLRMYQTLIWPLLIFLLFLWWICCFWRLTIVCFTCMERWLHDVGSQQQLPNANGTLITPTLIQTFYLLNWCRNNEGTAHIIMSMKWLLSKLSNYLWSLEKGGRYILMSCNSLTFPPVLIGEYPQIKAQSVHFMPIFIIYI